MTSRVAGRPDPGVPDVGALADLPFLDAHHHFFDLDRLYYPWLQDSPRHPFFLGDQRPLARQFLPEDYRRGASGHRVVGTVHVEAEVDRALQLAETEWLIELNAREGLPTAIVAHAWLDTPNAPEILEAQAAVSLVRGIRSKPVTSTSPDESVRGQRRSLQDPRWLDGYRRLAALGLSWDLRVPFWHLEEAARVALDHPDIPVVLDHTGFPWDRSEAGLALWRRGMRALAKAPHAWLKLSCLCVPGAPWSYQAHRDVVREAIDIFGTGRCMFASNVPPDTLQASFDTMLTAYKAMVVDFPRAAQEQLFHGNAARFYRIGS
jgi:predicted TIM-barrel fold metal-dependent hydrolase